MKPSLQAILAIFLLAGCVKTASTDARPLDTSYYYHSIKSPYIRQVSFIRIYDWEAAEHLKELRWAERCSYSVIENYPDKAVEKQLNQFIVENIEIDLNKIIDDQILFQGTENEQNKQEIENYKYQLNTNIHFTIQYLNHNLMTYSLVLEYQSGAHPEFSIKQATMEVDTLQPEKMSQLFKDGYQQIIQEKIREQVTEANVLENKGVPVMYRPIDYWDEACEELVDKWIEEAGKYTDTRSIGLSQNAVLITKDTEWAVSRPGKNVYTVVVPYEALKPVLKVKLWE